MRMTSTMGYRRPNLLSIVSARLERIEGSIVTHLLGTNQESDLIPHDHWISTLHQHLVSEELHTSARIFSIWTKTQLLLTRLTDEHSSLKIEDGTRVTIFTEPREISW